MDNPELVELLGSEFRFLIKKARRSGLTNGCIFAILAGIMGELIKLADADDEFWFRMYQEAGR